MINNLQSKK